MLVSALLLSSASLPGFAATPGRSTPPAPQKSLTPGGGDAPSDGGTSPAFIAFQSAKRALEANPKLTEIPGSLLIRFQPDTPPEDIASLLSLARCAKVRDFPLVPGLVHAQTDQPVAQSIATLTKSRRVQYAEPDPVRRSFATPNDPYFSLQWGLNNIGQSVGPSASVGIANADIDMPQAWDLAKGSTNLVVAVIDTGTQWSHPDLLPNIWINPGEIPNNGIDDDQNGYIDDVRGWDFYSADNNPDDENGHGTHTAGTIGAKGGNGIGVAGVAWSVQLMPLRFIGPQGGSTADVIAALGYAVGKGVRVSNNSWGGGDFSQSLYDAIASAGLANHLFVAAAGNSALNTDTRISYPSCYALDNILSVAAVDNRDRLAPFSNYGSTTVDLAAPGVDIASTYSNSQYVYLSGTSMAAPHVAGVAALLGQLNPSFSVKQVIDRILSTARPAPGMAGKCVTGGILNARAALAAGATLNSAPVISIASPVSGTITSSGLATRFTGSASDKEDGNISSKIAWTSDVTGLIGSGSSLSSVLPDAVHRITAAVSDSVNITRYATVSITVGSIPTPPLGVIASNPATGTTSVRWTDTSNNEVNFQIWRQTKSATGTWTQDTYITVNANVVSYTDKSGGGTFRYQVRSQNRLGSSAWTLGNEVIVK